MAKFKRFDEGNSKRGKDRRRDDYDSFDANDRRKYRQNKNDLDVVHRRRPNNKNYMYYDESEDI